MNGSLESEKEEAEELAKEPNKVKTFNKSYYCLVS